MMINDGSGEWHTTENLGTTLFDGDVDPPIPGRNEELARQEMQLLRQHQRRLLPPSLERPVSRSAFFVALRLPDCFSQKLMQSENGIVRCGNSG